MARAEYPGFVEGARGTHAAVLERIVPLGGLRLPPKPRFEQGTTGLRIHIYQFDSASAVNVSRAISDVYPDLEGVFPNALVLKYRGDEAHPYFENMGEVGNQTVLRETEVDQRVLASGLVPSSLGVVRMGSSSEGVWIFPDSTIVQDTRAVSMVMPYFDSGTSFGSMVRKFGGNGNFRKRIMEQAVALELGFERRMDPVDAQDYAGIGGVERLVRETFERARNWYRTSPGARALDPVELRTAAVAEEAFSRNFTRLLDDQAFERFLKQEASGGGFVDVHGDLRPYDNANVVLTNGGAPQVIFRDPVRLFRKDIHDWSNFHLTHREFQLGLLVGRMYTEGEQDLFRHGVEAHERALRGGNPLSSGWADHLERPAAQLRGLGLSYGMFVEILVARGKMQRDGYDGPSIPQYWEQIHQLAESEFLSWREKI